MITRDEALRLLNAYLARRSNYEAEQWVADDTKIEEFDHGWRVYVYNDGPHNVEMPPSCAFVLLVSRADGRIYLPRLTAIERAMECIGTDPSSLNLVFEPQDLDDDER